MRKPEQQRGPGYHRMKARLGPQRAEELRQQVLKEQVAALHDAAKSRPPAEGDHDAYKNYPVPKSKPRHK